MIPNASIAMPSTTSPMLELRRSREQLKRDGLVHGESHFPVSSTLIVAGMLLVIGVMAVVSMVYRVGPFGGA